MMYLVGISESAFEDQEFILVNAVDEQEARLTFLRQFAVEDQSFQEHVYEKTVNTSIAEHFWMKTRDEQEEFSKTEEITTDEALFKQRVREFFGNRTDYADLYIKHYFGPESVIQVTSV